jgi:signal transduction histidine kinase/ActR/RegA family two-component response regulator
MSTAQLPSSQSFTPGSPQNEIEQLKLANHYLRVALDQVSEGVILLDTSPLDGTGPRMIYSNVPAACTVGVEPGKGLRGLHLADLLASERDVVALLSALKDAAQSGAAECQAQIQTFYSRGSRFCTWRVKALHDSMKRLLNFTLTVLPVPNEFSMQTAPMTAQPKVEDMDAQAERLRVENMAALAHGIAHDVNNLLGPITAQLSLIMPKIEPGSELQKTLEDVLLSARTARQFTQQVVNTAKAKYSTKRPTHVQEIIDNTVRVSKAGSNVEVRVKCAPDLQPIMADPVKIAQVLQNLIINGMQAMPRGGFLDVEARNVEVRPGQDSALRPGPHVEIIVRDRGCGITPDNLRRLFNESFTTKADGNGIGLTTCKRFIDQHHGSMRVQSTVNVGTEFHLLLPACPANAAAPAPLFKPKTRPITADLKKGNGRVLIVEDELPISTIAARILHQCGYQVQVCNNGQDAVRVYQEVSRSNKPFDVVLMDLTLKGGMEGLETSRAIWKQDPGARIIVSSGSVTEDVQRSFLDQGFFAILPKPYEADELSDAIYEAVMLSEVAA